MSELCDGHLRDGGELAVRSSVLPLVVEKLLGVLLVAFEPLLGILQYSAHISWQVTIETLEPSRVSDKRRKSVCRARGLCLLE